MCKETIQAFKIKLVYNPEFHFWLLQTPDTNIHTYRHIYPDTLKFLPIIFTLTIIKTSWERQTVVFKWTGDLSRNTQLILKIITTSHYLV